MRESLVVMSLAALLAGCTQANDNGGSNEAAAKAAQPKKKAGYCFFKDSETKGWTASRGKDGNIIVEGKAYRSDPRYQALLGPVSVNGTSAELSPTIQQNATGYAAPDNWWDLTATVPNSAAIDKVTVSC